MGLILCRGTADAAVIRCDWRARGDVTSHLVTASVGWPEIRGGPCEARGLVCAINRVRVEMRGFQSGRISFVANCGGRVENIRALWKDKGRERPSLMLSGGRVKNVRTLRKDEGRERPSLRLNGDRAENTRTLWQDEGRERPSLPWTDSKAENARAFVIENKEPRTPAAHRIESGLNCSVPGRFILASRLQNGGRAKRRLLNAWRGARNVWHER